MMDAPKDEALAAIAPPNHCDLVLQISSLPGSSDPDKFFYNTYAKLESGNFAVACEFFIYHHNCPNDIAFQDLYPSANIG
jgi:hypothetical protein